LSPWKDKENVFYYLVLLDWSGTILSPDQLKSFTEEIMPSVPSPINSWATKSLLLPNLKDNVSNLTVGYYHSRLIFRGNLITVPTNIFEVRQLRTKLENELNDFVSSEIIPKMAKYTNGPRIFSYSVFEIRNKSLFWQFKREKTYSLPTTCFYTELDDPRHGWINFLINILRPKKVKVRISGAKIITSEMSDWFFWNLTNIVFHEGLYRQSRDSNLQRRHMNTGLENRLEDFANNLMTSFYQLSNTRVQDLIARLIVVLTIVGLIVAAAQFAFPFLSHFWPSLSSQSNSSAVNQTLTSFSSLKS
jgi:hypothetical protein